MTDPDRLLIESTRTHRERLLAAMVHGPLTARRKVTTNAGRFTGSLVLAAVLVFVVNRRSFGWTLQVTVPPEALVTAVVLALVAALLAGLYPAWRLVRTPPAEAMRTE